MNLLFFFLPLLLAQRGVELLIAKRHEKLLKRRGAREFDRNGYRIIVFMHAAFFASLALESTLLHRQVNSYWELLVAIFIGAQFIRYWAIVSLGVYWNTKIIIMPDHRVIKSGPYKFIRHPNYIAVITELIVVPLTFSCYITMIAFTLLNSIIISRRIKVETGELARRQCDMG